MFQLRMKPETEDERLEPRILPVRFLLPSLKEISIVHQVGCLRCLPPINAFMPAIKSDDEHEIVIKCSQTYSEGMPPFSPHVQ